MKDNSTASGSAKESSMTAAEDREAVVRWLREMSRAPTSASVFSWRERLFYAWWGLRNPSVSMVATRLAVAKAIEAGTHIMEKSDGETANER